MWERQPLVVPHHFQDEHNLVPPRKTDVVVVILWSRIGTNLPEDQFCGAVSGRRPVTGTEWEFEDALAAARQTGVPDLLLYCKTAEPDGRGTREALLERAAQLERIEDFFKRWFHSPDGKSLAAAFHSFASTEQFEEQLYDHLKAILARSVVAMEGAATVRWHEPPFRALRRMNMSMQLCSSAALVLVTNSVSCSQGRWSTAPLSYWSSAPAARGSPPW
jgi:hypothetical protein